jgi:putative glutamine amidotransferase
MSSVPVIGLPADRKFLEPHYYHCAGEKYLTAVVDAIGAIPVIIPALAQRLPLTELVSMLDGLLLTGAYSNIEPRHYGGDAPDPESPVDPQRDATNLALIPLALQAGVPVLGICRGLQELNVALGGSLHAEVHNIAGFNDHREPDAESLDVQYGPQHDIVLEAGGLLAELAGGDSLRVNSLHGQGIDRLADSLLVEARAPDGLIEAVRLGNEGQFALAVQWHPEWQVLDNPFYTAIFTRFGEACRARATQRRNQNK